MEGVSTLRQTADSGQTTEGQRRCLAPAHFNIDKTQVNTIFWH